jgi:hypothetical protein
MGAGWMGLACLREWGTSRFMAFLSSLGFGVGLMLLNASLMFAINKLNKEVHIDLREAIGHLAKVYLVIPARGEGTGQVEVTIADQLKVMRAVSEQGEIPTGGLVKVMDVQDGEILVVRPHDG